MWDGAFIHNPKGGEQHSTCVAVPQLANVDSRTRWFGQERPNELGKNSLVPGIGCGAHQPARRNQQAICAADGMSP